MTKNLPTIAVTAIIVVLVGALIAILVFLRNQTEPIRGVVPLLEIAAQEPDSSLWGQNFPNQYSTLQRTETNNVKTTYGGSEQFSHLEEDPRLLTLFAGYSFSKEYNEDRGHLNSLTDVRKIKRVTEKTPGTCYSCKSSDNPRLWAQMGMQKFDETLFKDLGSQINNSIGCANCHEAETMRLIVTNPALENALKAQGKDWTTFTRQEMRTVVCGNCHVEYYFLDDPASGKVKFLTFPWANGTNVDQIEAYYNDPQVNALFKQDWEHPDSKAPMLKMQHPEYEFFTANSTHYNAGVACADCHMPYTRDGAAKFSSHDVHSPLLNVEQACGQCHTDTDYVRQRVVTIQNQVRETMDNTEDAIVAAITAIKAAADAPNVNTAKLDEARQLHRSAQMRWDFIAAENSMGFHNPEEALRILADATDMARQAQLKALEATLSTVTGNNN